MTALLSNKGEGDGMSPKCDPPSSFRLEIPPSNFELDFLENAVVANSKILKLASYSVPGLV